MLSKENIVAFVARTTGEYKKHENDTKAKLRDISSSLAATDAELEFANLVGDDEQKLEINTRMKAAEEKKEDIIRESAVYTDKIKHFKLMTASYAKKKIEEANPEEIDLYKTEKLNKLEINAQAKMEAIEKLKEQHDRLEAAKKVNLANTTISDYKQDIEKIKKRYLAGVATPDELDKAKEMNRKIKELKATAEERAKEQEKAIHYQQEEINEKISEIEKELEEYVNAINELKNMSLEDYREHVVEELMAPVSQKEDLNNPFVINRKKAMVRVTDKEVRYQTEALLRKHKRLDNFAHFVVSVSNKYLSYVKDCDQNQGYTVDLSDEEKRESLRTQLVEDMADFQKIEELRTTDLKRIPTLSWAKSNGWLNVPINVNFYNENKLLGATFVPSATLRADSLNLSEMQRQLIIDTDTKFKIEGFKKKIEEDLWKEFGRFLAKQISLIYLNGRNIWPAKVQNSVILQNAFESILEKNAIYKKEAESLLNEIETFVVNSNMEKAEKATLESEIAKVLSIPAEFVKELIEKGELTEENISKANYANHKENNTEERNEEIFKETVGDYDEYFDDSYGDDLNQYLDDYPEDTDILDMDLEESHSEETAS